MQARKKIQEKVRLIAPHQNELPAAMPFMKSLARQFEAKGMPVEGSRLMATSSFGWRVRKLLSGNPDYPAKNVDILLSTFDALNRALHIAGKPEKGALIVEVHAWVPNKEAGFALEDQDIGNGFNLLPFIRLMEHYYAMAEVEPGMMRLLSKLMGNDAMQLLLSTQGMIRANHENIVCIEVPGVEAKPMIVGGKPHYDLYYGKDGGLLPQISGFEKLYCTHSIHGKGYSDADIGMVSQLLLENYK